MELIIFIQIVGACMIGMVIVGSVYKLFGFIWSKLRRK